MKKKNVKLRTLILVGMLILALETLLLSYLAMGLIANNLRKDVTRETTELAGSLQDTSEEALLEQAEDSLQAIATVQVEATNIRLTGIADTVEKAAAYIEEQMDAGQSEAAAVSGAADKFDTVMEYDETIKLYYGGESGYNYQYSDEIVLDDEYDARTRGWYQAASRHNDSTIWLETYIGYNGKATITAARAVLDSEGNVVGVMGADIWFDDLIEQIVADGLGETGENFMLGNSYNFIAIEGMEEEGYDTSPEAHFGDIKTLREHIADGDEGAFFNELDGTEVYMVTKQIPETGWFFCAAVDKDEIYQPMDTVETDVRDAVDDAAAVMTTKFKKIILNMAVSFLFITILALITAFRVSNDVVAPIKDLTRQVVAIGNGDFGTKVDVVADDEIGDLATSFNKMQFSLQAYTENLQYITAEKERIGSELNIATQIQADMLPRIFPPFPDKREVDIYATMDPAKEVGGDFYDFFLIDDTHLAFVIADVSGKGVPAALFMVISKTLLKNRAMQGGSPAEILSYVNNQLCEGNEAELFVTAWIGILDLETGVVKAANAGHEFPAIRDGNGHFELLKDKHGFVLAGMENMKYTDYEFTLEEGGGFYVYTDGVPEATNASNELFGTDRMLEALNRHPGEPPTKFLADVTADVQEFVGSAPQFDDITMVGLVWKGPESNMSKIVLDADTSKLAELQGFVEEKLGEHDCPPDVLMQIQVAVEEIFTNIASYAYPSGKGKAQVMLEFDNETPATVSIQFLDGGVQFDPLAKPDPDVTASAEERRIGGLGIYMVKKTMDDVKYEYLHDKNVLTITKKLVSAKQKKEV